MGNAEHGPSTSSGWRNAEGPGAGPRPLAPGPLIWACVIVLLASLPYMAGLWFQPPGAKFTGFTYNIDDACVYSSWIRQIADGSLLIRNQFTSEPQSAFQFNIFFILLGLIARITHLSPAAVLHLARILLGIGLLLAIWRFSPRFLRDPTERLLIVPLVGLSSGLGWLLPGIAGHQGPVDLWQPEAVTFLSIYLNPLFLVGLILMVGAFHFLCRMIESRSIGDAALAGVMLLLLGNIHTYDMVTVGAVWVAYLIVECIRTRHIPWRIVGLSALAAVIATPSIGYQLYLYKVEPIFRQRVGTEALSPAFWAYLMGFGLLVIFAAVGAWIGLKEKKGVLLLLIWSIAGFILPYAPVAQQRKLVMGIHIPLAILATIAIAAIAKRFATRNSQLAITVLLAAAMVPSNLLFMFRDTKMLSENTTAPRFRPYLTTSELGAMNWLRLHSKPDDVVLAFPDLALFVPAVARNRVYYGHWSETPDYKDKLNEWMTFVDASTPDVERREFLQRTDARYIIYFSHPAGITIPLGEDRTLQLADLRSANYMRVVFEAGDVAVYKIDD